MSLIFERLSYRIIGCGFDVWKQLGPGQRELLYQRAMEAALSREGIPWHKDMPVDVTYRGVSVGTAKIDLVVDAKIVLELKSARNLHGSFFTQLHRYLTATGFKVAIVLNFGCPERLQFKRIVA